jgi:hypothetical protein
MEQLGAIIARLHEQVSQQNNDPSCILSIADTSLPSLFVNTYMLQMDPNIPQCLPTLFPALITKLQRCVDTLELERSAAFGAAEQLAAKDAELNAKDEQIAALTDRVAMLEHDIAVSAAAAATAHNRKRDRQGNHLYITKHTTISLSYSAGVHVITSCIEQGVLISCCTFLFARCHTKSCHFQRLSTMTLAVVLMTRLTRR